MRRLAGEYVAHEVTQAVKSDSAPVLSFYLAFRLQIVSAEDLEHPRGVAAATCVLKKQREVKVGAIRLRI